MLPASAGANGIMDQDPYTLGFHGLDNLIAILHEDGIGLEHMGAVLLWSPA